MSNFISTGPCWKFDLWPINFDLWSQIYPRCTVHRMFYQIPYDGPARSTRCLDIAEYANLTPFFPGTGNDLKWPLTPNLCQPRQHWPMGFHMYKWYQCAILHMVDMNFKDIQTQTLYLTPVTPNDLRLKNHLTTFEEDVKVMHIHKLQDHAA